MTIGERKRQYSVYLTDGAYKRLRLLAIHTRSRSFSDLIERLSEGDPRVIELASKLWKHFYDPNRDLTNDLRS